MELRPGRAAAAVQEWLPPGLAADGRGQCGTGRSRARRWRRWACWGCMCWRVGGVLAVRLRAEYRGENLGEAPARKKAETRGSGWLLDGAGPMAAVMEKELHTLMRSMPLLYAIGAPLFMVVVFGSLFRDDTSGEGIRFLLALPLCVAYALLGFFAADLQHPGRRGDGDAGAVPFADADPDGAAGQESFSRIVFSVVALAAGILASPAAGPTQRRGAGGDGGVAAVCVAREPGGGERVLAHDAAPDEPGTADAAARGRRRARC